MASKGEKWRVASTHVLCVGCGYDVDGAVRAAREQGEGAGSCPECGKGIGQSDPEGWGGTAMESAAGGESGRVPHLERLASGVWRMVRGPRAEFARMRATRRWPLRWALLGVASVIVGVSAFVSEEVILQAPRSTNSWAVVVANTLTVCAILTGMESVGMRVIARTRGWRLTKRNAQAIADHACVGWVMGAIVGGLLAIGSAVLFSRHPEFASWSLRGTRPASYVEVSIDPALLHMLLPLLGVFVVGLLWFEWLCWLGMRARRFAADVE